jgi:hypothetical protein
MSVLDQTQPNPLTPAERSAKQVKRATSQMAYQLIQSWNHGWDLIWSSADPAAVLAELGTEAGELFQLNEDIIVYLNTTLAGRKQDELDAINAKVAAKPATTTAADCSVTID